MFFIFNKPKIYSYLIVLSTVVVLFFTAAVLSEANDLETLTTSSAVTGVIESPIEKVETNERTIAITINCLETDNNIEEILKILEGYSVKATFCIYGDWVKSYPLITREIDEAGHCIVNMSNNYKNISELSYDEVNKNIVEGENKISTLLNKEIEIFRCPYGKYSDELMKAANDNGYTVIGWGIDTLDYEGLEASIIWDNIKNKISNGDIISMNSNSEHISEEVELLVKSIQERGYNLVTVEELLQL